MSRSLRWIGAVSLSLAFVGMWILFRRVERMPELARWHTERLAAEFIAEDVQGDFDFADYLRQEEALFTDLAQGFEGSLTADPALAVSRYEPGGFNNPLSFPQNWNRTFELVPQQIRGGALLLHGLSDSPYSLRRVGEILAEEGYYVLGLRLAGHGTLPSGLLSVRVEDWEVAVELAVAAVVQRVAGRGPLLLAGYSNGGSLAVDYAIKALEEESLPRPDRLVLFSPAIGISSLARFADWHRLVSFLPWFEKLRWTDILPEYDPYKYNSFTKNAVTQSYRITSRLRRRIDRLQRKGGIGSLPPILTFASLVDATVMSRALVEDLYDKLDDPQSELVIFDVNRLALMKPFYRPTPLALLDGMEADANLPYRLTVISNEDAGSFEVMEWTRASRARQPARRKIGLRWPDNVYSLSHVAIPFPPDDPIYGGENIRASHGLTIGALEPRGEKALLVVPADLFLRLRHNPFFPYVEQRMRGLTAGRSAGPGDLP